MQDTDHRRALQALAASTIAFTACFAVWVLYGVLITHLVDERLFAFDRRQMGLLIGIPILTGSLVRLPVGLLTDRFGGRPVFTLLMLVAAGFTFGVSLANSYAGFLLCGLGFGLAGGGFAVGIAYTSSWFPMRQQGIALGVFGAGNAGAAITSMLAPSMLKAFGAEGSADAWRTLPRVYAAALAAIALLFWLTTTSRKAQGQPPRTLAAQLEPLRSVRVWRFGLYYFLVFGMFVALAQWLIPYYVNVYGYTVVGAGLLASIFTLPSGVIRAVGGWLSDRFGARTVMYWVLIGSVLCSALLVVPRMEIESPGEGIMAARAGEVTAVSPTRVVVDDVVYELTPAPEDGPEREGVLVFPRASFGQEPVVEVGEQVARRHLLARGVTRIYFQANAGIFTFVVFTLGILLGIGKAAVYKHIPEYFPDRVGTVGGIVGVIGGLGGFVGPLAFGALLEWSGIWTTTWLAIFAVSVVCLAWMHVVVRRMTIQSDPDLARRLDELSSGRKPG